MATSPATSAAVTTWKIDPVHSSAEFKVKHMMVSNIKGSIQGMTGDLTEHATDASLSSIDATLDASTVNTGLADRDAHLKAADFLDTEKYPKITFKSTKVEKKGSEEYAVTGNLTIHGVTKPVTLTVEGPSAPQKDPYGNTRIGLSATTKINRRDYGLSYNGLLEAGGLVVGDEVHITLDVEFIKA
jgi:polyisoprenoid-binding protein YceI